jgi:hypothetical protein
LISLHLELHLRDLSVLVVVHGLHATPNDHEKDDCQTRHQEKPSHDEKPISLTERLSLVVAESAELVCHS